MLYSVIAFHKMAPLMMKVWIRDEKEVASLLKEGFSVYRPSTDQQAHTDEVEQITWCDMHAAEDLKC